MHVLVTRPNPAGAELCALIVAEGITVTHLPTIAFTAPQDSHAFHETIKLIGEQDWLIFVSPQAVYASIPVIRRDWPHFPPQLQLAAIGAGTVRALQDAGYQAVIFPKEEWNSEGLLELSAFQTIQNKKVMLIRGEGGRELLAKELTDRGAQLSHLIAYQRILPNVDVTQQRSLLAKKQINAIICMSFEGIKHLKILFGDESWLDLQQVHLIVGSDRIKQLASDLGFRSIWVTKNPSHPAVLEVLAAIKKE